MSKRKYRRNYKRGFWRGYADGYADGIKAGYRKHDPENPFGQRTVSASAKMLEAWGCKKFSDSLDL